MPATQEQFRLSGKAYIYPSPDFIKDSDTSVAQDLKIGRGEAEEQLLAARKVFEDFVNAALAPEGFDWEKTRFEAFDAMNPSMRATWLRPIPGTPLPGGYEDAKKWVEKIPSFDEAKGKDKENWVAAFKNFAPVKLAA